MTHNAQLHVHGLVAAFGAVYKRSRSPLRRAHQKWVWLLVPWALRTQVSMARFHAVQL